MRFFRKDGFLSFKTNCYKLNYYETPTGMRIILNTDQQVGNIRDILHQLYSTVCRRSLNAASRYSFFVLQIFVTYIVKSPRCSPLDPIGPNQELFVEKLDEFISNLAIFSQANKV